MNISRNKVTVHPHYFNDLDQNSLEYKSLLEVAKSFATYWRDGYHSDFGRDKPLEYPQAVKDGGLCKVHVLTNNLSIHAQRIWDSKSKCELAPCDRSHCNECDSMLLYAISEEGTALVLSLYSIDAHELLKTRSEFTRALAASAIAYFKEIGEQAALEADILKFLQTPTC